MDAALGTLGITVEKADEILAFLWSICLATDSLAYLKPADLDNSSIFQDIPMLLKELIVSRLAEGTRLVSVVVMKY